MKEGRRDAFNQYKLQMQQQQHLQNLKAHPSMSPVLGSLQQLSVVGSGHKSAARAAKKPKARGLPKEFQKMFDQQN